MLSGYTTKQAFGTSTGRSCPSGFGDCHIAVVEVGPDTRDVRIDRYNLVDDIGTVINPRLAQAQIDSCLVQNVGQALLEDVTYDRDTHAGSGTPSTPPRDREKPNFTLLN